ncbi:hypothetical protein THAOC_15481 [Thalassiosira oceanica]|uniref:Uncharacterized protein n=1 Tax=Thalassiosira oceanica TaxID=159749 RepID=K0SCK7_THAOC|nr:hypothetical protein THAOC_15481 [Thalassiosira oceanica]|eukprot:EJK63843.1 hypothetical protein THAOC_15481 [Thalassiosira oceanica]
MIASGMSRRLLRAAGGLRRPSESRSFLASRSTIYLDDACGSSRDRWTFPIDLSMTQGRTGDPKTMGTIDRAKQHRAEAASGPDGDDNGPGSEPPPHCRFRYVSTFVTSRRRPPAAVGKPSFTYFPVDCLPHDVLRPDEPTDLREGDLPDATSYERSEDIGPNRRNLRIGAVCPALSRNESSALRQDGSSVRTEQFNRTVRSHYLGGGPDQGVPAGRESRKILEQSARSELAAKLQAHFAGIAIPSRVALEEETTEGKERRGIDVHFPEGGNCTPLRSISESPNTGPPAFNGATDQTLAGVSITDLDRQRPGWFLEGTSRTEKE